MGFLLYKLNSSLISILAHFVHYLHCSFHCALSFSFMLCSCVIHQGSKALSCEKLRAAYQLKHSSYNNRTTTRETKRKQTNKQAARQKETDKRSSPCFPARISSPASRMKLQLGNPKVQLAVKTVS